MKRGIVLTAIVTLALGFVLGVFCSDAIFPSEPAPQPPAVDAMLPAGSADSASSTPKANVKTPFNPKDNYTLLSAACSVTRAMREEDYALLSAYADAERGVTFTPYSSVDFEQDVTLTADQLRNLGSDTAVYTWGVIDGLGEPLKLTISDYFARYVFNADYTQAPQIGIDRIQMGGNALENLPDAYPDCRFVDFTFPGTDPSIGGLDWCSLKLVFQAGSDGWKLVGVVHGEWTI